MRFFNSLKKNLFSIDRNNFNAAALSLFRFQAENNPVYKKYIGFRGIDPMKVDKVEKIPFLPIEFFKTQVIKTMEWPEKMVFISSGTTGQTSGRHFIEDPAFYLRVAEKIFVERYGSLEDYHIFGLLPSYLERGHSSLVYMVAHFIQKSRSSLSGFYLYDHDTLATHLKKAAGRKILLFGVTFALLDFAQSNPIDIPGIVAMDTGGMKGRRKEMVREEVHEILKKNLNCHTIHSEYGMTELMSQAYSSGEGRYRLPPWMRIFIREINDPFRIDARLRHGGVNVIDLANIHSCAFIETKDLGRVNEEEGYFEPLGRFDNSDVRGCNLMMVNQ